MNKRIESCMLGLLLPLLALCSGCDSFTPESDRQSATAVDIGAAGKTGAYAKASGGGHFFNPAFGVDVQFAFTAVQQDPDGDAVGTYHFSATSLNGLAIDLRGQVTCMTADPENPHRAWMGGVITKNASEHPFFTGETSREGRDAWFRVADYGEGTSASQPDRITMIFFEPAGGFTSASAFCDAQLWFPEDRLTNSLLNGNIQVKP